MNRALTVAAAAALIGLAFLARCIGVAVPMRHLGIVLPIVLCSQPSAPVGADSRARIALGADASSCRNPGFSQSGWLLRRPGI